MFKKVMVNDLIWKISTQFFLKASLTNNCNFEVVLRLKNNELKSLKVTQSEDDNYGCKDDNVLDGVIDCCDGVCTVV